MHYILISSLIISFAVVKRSPEACNLQVGQWAILVLSAVISYQAANNEPTWGGCLLSPLGYLLVITLFVVKSETMRADKNRSFRLYDAL